MDNRKIVEKRNIDEASIRYRSRSRPTYFPAVRSLFDYRSSFGHIDGRKYYACCINLRLCSCFPVCQTYQYQSFVFLSFFLNLVTITLHRFVSKKMRTRSCAISFRHLGKLSTKFLSVSFGLPRFSSSNQF